MFELSRRAFFAGALVPIVCGCVASEPTLADYCYRLRIVVSVDGNDCVGQSTIRVLWHDLSRALMNYGSSIRATVWGEAVAVDLGPKHGMLFGLLQGSRDGGDEYFSPTDTPVAAFSSRDDQVPSGGADYNSVKAMPTRTGAVELFGVQRPMFVRFEDIADPSTVSLVDPDNFSATYGDGVLLKGTTVERVEGEPTQTIASILPWTSTYHRTLGDVPEVNSPLFAAKLSSSSFRSWENPS